MRKNKSGGTVGIPSSISNPTGATTCDPVEFQAFAWNVDDGTNNEQDFANMNFTVHIFGKDRSGKSVGVHVKGYHPTFCLKVEQHVATEAYYEAVFELLSRQLVEWNRETWEISADYSDHLRPIADPIIERKDCWGFHFAKQVPFFQFSFRSMRSYNKAISFFKACQKNDLSVEDMTKFYDEYDGLRDDSGRVLRQQQRQLVQETSVRTGIPEKALNWIVKLGKVELPFEFAKGKLFEVIDPILRFAHIRHLKMAGWMRVNKYSRHIVRKHTTCDIELSTSYYDLDPISEKEMEERNIAGINPHIKEMSFDIEAYSHNDLFPDPHEVRNVAYQIGITIKQYADTGFHRRLLHLVTPKELHGTQNTGRCNDMVSIPTCLRSMKPVENCALKDCKRNNVASHDVFNVETKVENFDTERELLLRFADIIVKEDPDMIYGYNSDIFDWNYLMVRAQKTGCMHQFCKMSRLRDYHCKVESKAFNSSAYGDNKYLRVDIPGRLNIDLMIWVQRNMPQDRYPSYSLDTVAEKEIQEQKRDVDAKDIFQAFRSGDENLLTTVGDYCCQDTMLVQKLVNKLDVVTQMFEMANITDTPPMYLLQKGQQIKCFSQLSKEAREKGYLIPLAEERDEGNFKGAVVIVPDVGKYDTPVSVLDFASLYPSIQMAYQVCYTTIVLDRRLHDRLMALKTKGEPLKIDGVSFDIIEWEEEEYVYRDKKSECLKCSAKKLSLCDLCGGTGVKTLRFADEDDAKKVVPRKEIRASIEKNDDSAAVTWRIETKKHAYAFAQGQQSLVPDLQRKLKQTRKAVKRMMAPIEHAKDPDSQLRYRVLNGRQLAIKVSMNSIYGFTSAFMMNLRALSAAVTAKGRQMIEQSKEFMETRFEQIARKRVWTMEDEYTFFAPDGKQVLARAQVVDGVNTWILEFNGKELARSPVGVLPQNADGKTWVKKYPTAVMGRPWTEHDLNIRVVYGDTDSVFVHYPHSTLGEAIALSRKASDLLTENIFARAPIEMEYEKTYMPLFIQKKKNYIGIKYEMDDAWWKIDFKGIAVKRRNYCDFVKQVFWSVIHPALGVETYEKNGKQEMRKVKWDFHLRPDMAIAALKNSLSKLISHQVSMDDLVISASLKSNYKGPTCNQCNGKKTFACSSCKGRGRGCDVCMNKGHKDCTGCGGRGIIVNLPHVQLAKRMKERDEGSAPISGQRFGFVVVNDDSRPNELSAKTEDPKYAKKHGLKPDYMFYLEQQIQKPLSKFLALLDKSEETEKVFAEVQNELFAELKRARKERDLLVRNSFFNANGKRPNPVAALKAPKRQAVSREQKKQQNVRGMNSLESFFNKPM